MATAHLHGPAEAATRIIPAVAPLTIDSVTEVRQTAIQALTDFSQVLRDHSKLLEDQAIAAGELCIHRPIQGHLCLQGQESMTAKFDRLSYALSSCLGVRGLQGLKMFQSFHHSLQMSGCQSVV